MWLYFYYKISIVFQKLLELKTLNFKARHNDSVIVPCSENDILTVSYKQNVPLNKASVSIAEYCWYSMLNQNYTFIFRH